MATTQQTPRQQADKVSNDVAKIVAASLATYIAASATTAPLRKAGISISWLSKQMVAMYKPLVSARIYVLRRRADAEFSDALPTDGPNVDQVQAFILDEIRWEEKFAERSARRIARDLVRATQRGASEDELRATLAKALDRERRFNMMRQRAASRRLLLRIEEAQVHAMSPDGAYWVLDPSLRTHTADCLSMAGKLWSWDVLRHIRPSNRHVQCGCRLITASMARANGMPGSDVVQRSRG